jgi:hypothetical protein
MRSCALLSISLGLAACLSVSGAFAAKLPAPFSLSTLKPTSEPPNWIPLVPASRTSLLWSPPYMRRIPGDAYSVSTALRDRSGKVTLVYLNAGPKTGGETMDTWPSFRIAHLREERARAVHEEARASGLGFRGGRGSCVMDDYITRRLGHHYRELACFVKGRTAASVIVAAALVSEWPRYGSQLVRAVESWQVR